MRKRNVQILFRLTEEEAEQLNELVRKSGRSKEAFLRETVKGYRPVSYTHLTLPTKRIV